MALELKYTGVDVTFEIEEEFLEDLEHIGSTYVDDILSQMNDICLSIDNRRNQIQTFAGVSHAGSPLFFELTVLKEEGRHPYFIEVTEITADDYLDYLLLKKPLKATPS
tara:strand:- start:1371 stop:1697 length:327 start_codon:yes stop_codon:yes gene_type:complete